MKLTRKIQPYRGGNNKKTILYRFDISIDNSADLARMRRVGTHHWLIQMSAEREYMNDFSMANRHDMMLSFLACGFVGLCFFSFFLFTFNWNKHFSHPIIARCQCKCIQIYRQMLFLVWFDRLTLLATHTYTIEPKKKLHRNVTETPY